jgi:hypothetical protein
MPGAGWLSALFLKGIAMDVYVRDRSDGQAELVVNGVVEMVGSYDDVASVARSIKADAEEDARNAAYECLVDEERNS